MNSKIKQISVVFTFIFAVMLSACTPPAPATPAPIQPTALPPTSAPTLAPSATATQVPSPAVTEETTSIPPSGGSASLDPCELLDSTEALHLTGVSFGNGVLSTLDSGVKICTYGANTANVLMVEVGQAPDANAAKALQAEFLSNIKEGLAQFGDAPIQVKEISDFGSGAVSVTLDLNPINVTGSAFGFRKNTIFFGMSDLVKGGHAPTADAMRAEAAYVLGELP